ncbi:MAG: Hpt domain-containing protein [Candidatus Woesearchaeota archaeon]
MNEEYLDIFLEETQESIDTLNRMDELIASKDYDVLRRTAHTIKGNAALLGFNQLSELSKCIEFTFKKIINNKIMPDDVSELLKKSVKKVEEETAYIRENKKESGTLGDLISQFEV